MERFRTIGPSDMTVKEGDFYIPYETGKAGRVVSCDSTMFEIEISTYAGNSERRRIPYAGTQGVFLRPEENGRGLKMTAISPILALTLASLESTVLLNEKDSDRQKRIERELAEASRHI